MSNTEQEIIIVYYTDGTVSKIAVPADELNDIMYRVIEESRKGIYQHIQVGATLVNLSCVKQINYEEGLKFHD